MRLIANCNVVDWHAHRPFALGDAQSIDQILRLLPQPARRLGETAGDPVFLAGQHFLRRAAELPGDEGTSRVFDLVAEARHAADSGQVDRFHETMQKAGPNWVAVICPPVPGTFVKQTMNDLVDRGERMGRDPSSWVPADRRERSGHLLQLGRGVLATSTRRGQASV